MRATGDGAGSEPGGVTRPSKKAPTAEQIARYVVRTCRTMHGCALCTGTIENGQQYHDGGLDRRAHVECVAGALRAPPDHEREAADILEELERDPGDPLGVWELSTGTLRALIAKAEARGREGSAARVHDLTRALECALAVWCPRGDPGGDGADGETWALCRALGLPRKEQAA